MPDARHFDSAGGMVDNLNDSPCLGHLSFVYAAHGLSVGRIGLLAALFPAVWGLGQILTGWWSDRIGRKHLITAGMLLQATAIGDVAHPAWRARAVGVYRLWCDGGFAVGALLAGALADAYGLTTAIWSVAALTGAAGVVIAVRMYETHPRS